MKKKIIISILLTLSISIFSQNKKLKESNTKINEKLLLEISNEKKIENLQKLINNKSDSLNREILYYKVKEDFYSTALADQGNRFTIIISGILALFSIITFGAFKYEVNKTKKETDKKLSKHKKEINEYKSDLKETKTDLKLAKANLSTSIALHFEKEKNYVNAFFYFISASKGHGESSQEKKDANINDDVKKKHYETCVINLNLALKNLKKISTDSDKESLKTKEDSIKKLMNDIYILNDDEVRNKISTLRYELISLLNDIKTPE